MKSSGLDFPASAKDTCCESDGFLAYEGSALVAWPFALLIIEDLRPLNVGDTSLFCNCFAYLKIMSLLDWYG
ncbi:predicted protein [Sclerotinia sclerotiorum 1980 UF-70]|uniref:Uncharacterized protein n=1 Tax=Sclerotinia sclerotiorum (strain ATCC 18683 / 1980 / Ss-1) TaxID=665079 RepID=A7EAV4_SCLS1|nr:predicted protein [Sclerotinia sclerotiorum 1980 UF-70]EDN99582.1 predicted protein [Sclerotinia sclerotiorum 1980 UF-70]